MKKIIVLGFACFITSVVSADLDINFGNDATAVLPVEITEVLGQLIWSATAPITQSGIDASLGAGEFLLASVISLTDYGFFAEGVSTYLDSDVGDANINNGYFFVRLFDNSNKVVDDWYLQFDMEGPNLTEADTEPRPTAYLTANLMPGGGFNLNDATYGHQIIPEPAVASLIILFGTGLLGVKRIFLKS